MLFVLVADRHQFKNSQLIYRFRVDDGTLHLTNQALDTLAKVEYLHTHIISDIVPMYYEYLG